MNITIPERLRPFSHLPGTQVLVPGSDWVIQAFPTLLKIADAEIPLCASGPVKDFTVQSDLERECVWIWGTAPDGYFRLQIFATKEGLKLRRKKEETLIAKGGHFVTNKTPERLFLGCHKAQDWDLARRRLDSREIAPMLFLLGQKVPGKPAEVEFDGDFCSFYQSSFSGLFCAHTVDPLHHGISKKASSGNLISGAYLAIRALLIDEDKILPHLPAEWVSGKVTNLQTKFGVVDLEWSRGTIRRLFLHAGVYRNNLKDREFGKEGSQNFCSERATIAERQGASENKNSVANPMQPKTDSSSCFGIESPFQFAKPIRTYRVRKVRTKILYDNFKS